MLFLLAVHDPLCEGLCNRRHMAREAGEKDLSKKSLDSIWPLGVLCLQARTTKNSVAS
jgi:hypothetical protein